MLRNLLLTVLLLLAGCAKSLPPDMLPAGIVKAYTDDGWTLPLRHYPGPGKPVVLVHGMGANHYNWDYRPEVSLAAYLQQQGWDVWVPELRGDPGAVAPYRRAAKEFSFDDHALYDLPPVIDAVRVATGAPKVYFVGHSMGGMLLYTALARYPERIAAGVAVGSPADFDTLFGIHKKIRAMGWAVQGRGRIPAAFLAKLSAPLGRANPLYARLGNKANLDFPIANGMAKRALVDLPRPMVLEVTRWLKSSDLVTLDGRPWLDDVHSDVPLLVMGGAVDKVVPAADVKAACDRIPDCTYRLLGKAGGFSTDYGHIDPIVGRTARDEVYPVIAGFLAKQAGDDVAALPGGSSARP